MRKLGWTSRTAAALAGVVVAIVAGAPARAGGANPVFPAGSQVIDGTGTDFAANPAVVRTPQGLEMWYQGLEPSGNGALFHATSQDGVHWSAGTLALSHGGGWEGIHLFNAAVLYDAGTYRAWYTGYGGGPNQIGYATSTDGVHWTKDAANPVVTNGSWDSTTTRVGSVLRDDSGTYHMWFTGSPGYSGPLKVGHAVSSDGVSWTRDANLVFEDGTAIDWGKNHASVTFTAGRFLMVYSSSTGTLRTALSDDGVTWTAAASSTALAPAASGFDAGLLGPATVLADGGRLHLWYTAFASGPGADPSIGTTSIPWDDAAPAAFDDFESYPAGASMDPPPTGAFASQWTADAPHVASPGNGGWVVADDASHAATNGRFVEMTSGAGGASTRHWIAFELEADEVIQSARVSFDYLVQTNAGLRLYVSESGPEFGRVEVPFTFAQRANAGTIADETGSIDLSAYVSGTSTRLHVILEGTAAGTSFSRVRIDNLRAYLAASGEPADDDGLIRLSIGFEPGAPRMDRLRALLPVRTRQVEVDLPVRFDLRGHLVSEDGARVGETAVRAQGVLRADGSYVLTARGAGGVRVRVRGQFGSGVADIDYRSRSRSRRVRYDDLDVDVTGLDAWEVEGRVDLTLDVAADDRVTGTATIRDGLRDTPVTSDVTGYLRGDRLGLVNQGSGPRITLAGDLTDTDFAGDVNVRRIPPAPRVTVPVVVLLD